MIHLISLGIAIFSAFSTFADQPLPSDKFHGVYKSVGGGLSCLNANGQIFEANQDTTVEIVIGGKNGDANGVTYAFGMTIHTTHSTTVYVGKLTPLGSSTETDLGQVVLFMGNGIFYPRPQSDKKPTFVITLKKGSLTVVDASAQDVSLLAMLSAASAKDELAMSCKLDQDRIAISTLKFHD